MGDKKIQREALKRIRRIVVKVGSSILASVEKGLHHEAFSHLAREISDLKRQGYEIVLVSSGAIAAGEKARLSPAMMDRLRLTQQVIEGMAEGLREVAQVFPHTEREAIREMLQLEEEIDLIIPRGGEKLIRFVTAHSKIPVVKHYKGVCHIFVDESADPEMAVRICLNAKVQRPGVCNAMETLFQRDEITQLGFGRGQR